MSDVKSNVKLPIFDGKESNFANWWTKFRAFSRFSGFGELLIEDKPLELKDTENDPDHGDGSKNAEAKRLFKLNSLCVASLTCAFSNDNHVCMGFVQDGMTKA